ncbi:MAG: hypothetical protein GC137_10950 [Alphaproteobacteria bacterium]|nr:hypothetical protein [Alphaproteobacteria bacterium]
MSDNFDNIISTAMVHKRVCHVAYTLNDWQPVLCTYIGDQPLYYFEEDVIDDDDGVFDPAELEFLEGEIEHLRAELERYEEAAFHVPQHTVQRFQEFAENIESLEIAPIRFDERLAKVVEILKESRVAASYLTVAEKHDITISMSDQVETSFYDRRSGSILLNPNMEQVDHIMFLAKELRRHWQHRQGVLINPLLFQPEHAILVHRAQEADLVTSVIRVAWELQLANIKDVWTRIENSPMADLSRAYAREAFLDFRTINNGVANAAVFEAWFLSERCRQHDKKIIKTMLDDYNGYVFHHSGPSKQVTAELIAGLGEMPFGKNYLAIHAGIIMDDPIFNEVRDRANANFLWFIKFERTFKESEQHLHLDTELSTGDIRHDVFKDQGQGYGKQQGADIIQLFEQQSNRKPQPAGLSARAKNQKSADVIDIRRWTHQKHGA